MPTQILPPVKWEKTKFSPVPLSDQEEWGVLPYKFKSKCVLKATITEISLLTEEHSREAIYSAGFDIYANILKDAYVKVDFESRPDIPAELIGNTKISLCVYDCGFFHSAWRKFRFDGVLQGPLIHGFWNNPWNAFRIGDVVLVLYDKVNNGIPLKHRLILIGHSTYNGAEGRDNNFIIPVKASVDSYNIIYDSFHPQPHHTPTFLVVRNGFIYKVPLDTVNALPNLPVHASNTGKNYNTLESIIQVHDSTVWVMDSSKEREVSQVSILEAEWPLGPYFWRFLMFDAQALKVYEIVWRPFYSLHGTWVSREHKIKTHLLTRDPVTKKIISTDLINTIEKPPGTAQFSRDGGLYEGSMSFPEFKVITGGSFELSTLGSFTEFGTQWRDYNISGSQTYKIFYHGTLLHTLTRIVSFSKEVTGYDTDALVEAIFGGIEIQFLNVSPLGRHSSPLEDVFTSAPRGYDPSNQIILWAEHTRNLNVNGVGLPSVIPKNESITWVFKCAYKGQILELGEITVTIPWMVYFSAHARNIYYSHPTTDPFYDSVGPVNADKEVLHAMPWIETKSTPLGESMWYTGFFRSVPPPYAAEAQVHMLGENGHSAMINIQVGDHSKRILIADGKVIDPDFDLLNMPELISIP